MGVNMVFSIEIGNSFIKSAVFDDNDIIISRSSFASKTHRSSDEYRLLIKQFLDETLQAKIDAVVISSVVPSITPSVSRALEELFGIKPFIIGSGTHTGFKLKIKDPSELGADIVSNTAAAKADHKTPIIIIDMGTATTLTAIDRSGDLTGVIIHPGIKVCASALSDSAALLSDVDISKPKNLIGQNSAQSIQSGIINGHIAMIDGLIERLSMELCDNEDELSLVATGEFSPYVVPFCKHSITIDRDLTLRGSVILYRMNRR
ncbi:MAG: type III pantothenate kinase [Clostridia bacterium]|nr:type III pantothenate kinase [Clostridia bacterium]